MKVREQAAVLLAAGLLAAPLLTSCRSSPVLQQVIYTYTAPSVDEEQEQLDPEDEGREDDRFENEERDTADTIRDTTQDEGLEDDRGDGEHSMQTEYDSAKPGDTAADDQPAGQGTAREPETSAQPETTPAETDNGAAPGSDNPGNGGGEEPQPLETAGETRTYKQVVDATGESVEVPEDVGTVTALGAAGQMVEMLGGSGRLVGADGVFLSSGLARSAFEDLGGVNSYWQTGGSGISDADFASLVAAKPDVCFAFSGQSTFTNAQVEQLGENGISYVVLPALSSAENLKLAVSIVGQVLGGEAVELAAEYADWVDGVISDVSSRTAGTEYVTLYLSQWDSDATYHLSEEYTPGTIATDGTGMAVAYSPLKAQLVSTFLSAAHLTNESTNILSRYRESTGIYVAPMFHQFNATVSGSRGVYYATGIPTAYDLFVSHQAADSVYYQLGWREIFPAIIVADSSIRSQIESCYFWQYHECNAAGYVEEGGQNLYRGVAGNYEIYVNPQGMCSWAEGSLESPLEAYWAACKFTGAYSMDEVKEKTRSFYRQFFGVSLSDSQLTEIFGE